MAGLVGRGGLPRRSDDAVLLGQLLESFDVLVPSDGFLAIAPVEPFEMVFQLIDFMVVVVVLFAIAVRLLIDVVDKLVQFLDYFFLDAPAPEGEIFSDGVVFGATLRDPIVVGEYLVRFLPLNFLPCAYRRLCQFCRSLRCNFIAITDRSIVESGFWDGFGPGELLDKSSLLFYSLDALGVGHIFQDDWLLALLDFIVGRLRLSCWLCLKEV